MSFSLDAIRGRRKTPNPSTTGYSHPSNEPKHVNSNISNEDISGLNTDEQILHELRELNRLYRLQAELATDEPLKTQALWNFLLQAFGLVAGTLFGVFAILAWQAARQANDVAVAANQIALAGYCQSQTNNNICSGIQRAASNSVSSYASAYYGITTNVPTSSKTGVRTTTETTTVTSDTIGSDVSQPTSTTTTGFVSSASSTTTTTTTTGSSSPSSSADASSSSPPSSSHSHIGAIVGGVIGGVVGLSLIASLPVLTYRARKRKYDDIRPMLVQRYD